METTRNAYAAPAPPPPSSRLREDFLPCLLLWLAGLGAIDDAAIIRTGLSANNLDDMRMYYRIELMELTWLGICGEALTPPLIAQLIRARVSEFSMTAHKPSDLNALSRAVKTLPAWIWDDSQPLVPVRGGSGGNGGGGVDSSPTPTVVSTPVPSMDDLPTTLPSDLSPAQMSAILDQGGAALDELMASLKGSPAAPNRATRRRMSKLSRA